MAERALNPNLQSRYNPIFRVPSSLVLLFPLVLVPTSLFEFIFSNYYAMNIHIVSSEGHAFHFGDQQSCGIYCINYRYILVIFYLILIPQSKNGIDSIFRREILQPRWLLQSLISSDAQLKVQVLPRLRLTPLNLLRRLQYQRNRR